MKSGRPLWSVLPHSRRKEVEDGFPGLPLQPPQHPAGDFDSFISCHCEHTLQSNLPFMLRRKIADPGGASVKGRILSRHGRTAKLEITMLRKTLLITLL